MPNATELRHAVIELRQYTLHRGQRDALITLFDREFIETQEAVGMTVLGQFRDLDDADRFVWLRGFASMAARAEALTDFYGGPVWHAHRDAANATMADSDNVLLLRPAGTSLPLETWRRGKAPAGALLTVVYPLAAAPEARFVAALMHDWLPLIRRHGGTLAGCCVTESSANTFPRLPVREREQVLVALARFATIEGCDRAAAASRASHDALARIGDATGVRVIAPPQVLRLAPTARSRF